MKRKVCRIHCYTAEKRKPTIPTLSRIKHTAFLISLIILSDLSTILNFAWLPKALIARILLVSNTFDIGEYNFLRWIEQWYFCPYWPHKTKGKSQQNVNRETPRLIGKKTFLEKRNLETERIILSGLSFKSYEWWIAGIEINFEINFPSINTTFYTDSSSGIFVLVWRIKPEIKPSKQSVLRVQD
jgi:hypothetical protein